MSVLYFVTMLMTAGQVTSLDTFDGSDGITPLLRVTSSHLYAASENTLYVYDMAGNLENTYALASSAYGEGFANLAISTVAPLSAAHQHRVLLTFMAMNSGKRVFRTVLLDQLGHELGLLINPALPDAKSVYFRDFYDMGDGTLIANSWQSQTEWDQQSVSLDRVLIDAEETIAGETFFRFRFAGESFAVKFFEKGDFMGANKAVFVNRRSDGYYVVGLPMENKVGLYLPKSGTSAKKVAAMELDLEGFQPYSKGDEQKQAMFSTVLGMTQAPDGMWVAYYPQFNPTTDMSNAEIRLQKLGVDATLLPTPNRHFGCFANGKAYFLSLENGTLEVETVELP